MSDEPLAREREPIERVRARLEALVMANAAPRCGAGNTKKRRTYQPRVFDGRVIISDEIERIQRIHKEVLEFERIEAISDPMRELVEDLWPELVHKLPPRPS